MYSKLITSVATLALILPTLAGTADARSSFGGGQRQAVVRSNSNFGARAFTSTARPARVQQQAIARPKALAATTRPMRTRNTVQLSQTNPASAGAMKTRSGTFGVNNGAGAIFGSTPTKPSATPANPAGGPIKLGANSVPTTATMNPTSGNAAGTSIVANTPPPHGTAIGTASNPGGGPIKLGANAVPTTSTMNSTFDKGAINAMPPHGSVTAEAPPPAPPINNGRIVMGGGSTPGATPPGGGSPPSGGGSIPTGGGSIPVGPGMGGGVRIVIPGQRPFPPAIDLGGGGPVATVAPNLVMPLPQPAVVQRRVAKPHGCLVKDYLRGAVMFKDVCTNEWALNASDGVLKASAGNCLTKEYPQANVVLFKDVCTTEWAMNPPPAR